MKPVRRTHDKQAIIVFGPPGSGKSTQANLLARRMSGIHLDTGRYVEEILFPRGYSGQVGTDSKKTKNLERYRRQFRSGELVNPQWILKMISTKVRQIHKAGFSVLFSGSPRTEYEAERLLPILSRLYGKQNVKIFILNVSERTSIKRNSNRLVCPFCDLPSLGKGKICAICGHALKRRIIDTPKIIKERLVEYQKRTKPVLDVMHAHGYRVVSIDGEPAPYRIVERILKNLTRNES